MRNLFIISVMALGLAFSAVASDSTNSSLFNGRELSASIGTAYVPNSDYQINFVPGVSYFITRNFGLEASVPVYAEGGSVLNNVNFGAVARVPIQFSLINKDVALAPYIGVGANYNWDYQNCSQLWHYVGKVGTELRINPKWGVFAEGQYTINKLDTTSTKNGNWGVFGGLRLVF